MKTLDWGTPADFHIRNLIILAERFDISSGTIIDRAISNAKSRPYFGYVEIKKFHYHQQFPFCRNAKLFCPRQTSQRA